MNAPVLSESARRILSLVSGYPREVRQRMGLLMMQAFVDESCTDEKLFVMAGYIAPVESWLSLTDEWARLLTLGPPHYRKISEFKMCEMKTSALGIEQSRLFYDLIEKHVLAGVSCVVSLPDLQSAFDATEWPAWLDNTEWLSNPHLIAFKAITNGLALYQGRLGFDAPIDFVFDNTTQKGRCLHAWEIMKKISRPEIQRFLGDTPIFRDSVTTLPVQTADIYAHWVREAALCTDKNSEALAVKFPWPMNRDIPGINFYHRAGSIKKEFDRTIEVCDLLRAGATYEELNQIFPLPF